MREFSVLSDVEFEDLVADLFAAEYGVPVERFAHGPDRGIDLRWSKAGVEKPFIGQCKHYSRSTFPQLLAAARAEVAHVSALSLAGYKFITSADLSVGQKDQIYAVFVKWMASSSDVIGNGDIDGLLTIHTHVERRHPKLWLWSGSQLFWATHSDIANRSSALRDRLTKSLPRYVVNKGYDLAQAMLDQHRVCIIAGIPGIGKTTLAHVLLANALSLGYEPIEVSRDIEDGWSSFRDNELQVFLYDDFLGQLSFAERLSKNEDKRLSDFVSKVASTKTKLLVMTTREYILQDARRTYELLNSLDRRMHLVLALNDYTRGDRARILYNHLWHADISDVAIREVADGGYRAIVDHHHYSPRLIEYCTGSAFDTQSQGYVDRFIGVLDHPTHLWRTAFEKHLTLEQQFVAVTLATLPSPAEYDDLQLAHQSLSDAYSIPTSAGSFRAALEVMEGTFIAVGKSQVSSTLRFHNPSIREFMLDWLGDDPQMIERILQSAVFFEQPVQLFAYAGNHSALYAALKLKNGSFTDAFARLIHSPSIERQSEWTTENGQIRQPISSWFEQRMVGLLQMHEPWKPPNDWLMSQVETLIGRWREHMGGKDEAVKLIRQLEAKSQVSAEPGGFSLDPNLVIEAAAALDAWLAVDLDEMEKDWLPYLTRLERDHHLVLSSQRELADKFEKFARDELSSWSPAPPELDQLIDYANHFGLQDLVETLEETAAEERARDERVGGRVTTSGSSVSVGSWTDKASDEDLDELFSRLNHRFRN